MSLDGHPEKTRMSIPLVLSESISSTGEEINSLFNLQKENIINIFRNNSRINHNRKLIQDKIAQVDLISKKAQDLVANFHQFLYDDEK